MYLASVNKTTITLSVLFLEGFFVCDIKTQDRKATKNGARIIYHKSMKKMSFEALIVTNLEILDPFGTKKNNQVTKFKIKGSSK